MSRDRIDPDVVDELILHDTAIAAVDAKADANTVATQDNATQIGVLAAEVQALDVRVTALEGQPPVEPPVELPVEPPIDPDPPTQPPTPPDGWPETFMGYEPVTSPMTRRDETGFVIEGYSFGVEHESRLANWGEIGLAVYNSSDFTIRNVDMRRLSEGGFLFNCHDFTIEWSRFENILGPNHDDVGHSKHSGNAWQLDSCTDYRIRFVTGRYGQTEDVISQFRCKRGGVSHYQYEGAIEADRPTSDGSPSIVWDGRAGTGVILGDRGGEDLYVEDSTLLNPGQVGVQVAGGLRGRVERVTVYGEPYVKNNTGMTTWCKTNAGNANRFVDNRVYYRRSDGSSNGFWNHGVCNNTVTEGNNWNDTSLDPEDLRVVL